MDSNLTHYVAGFAFRRDRTEVALIKKLHPDWQKGKWNAIGGKIRAEGDRPKEFANAAMQREFREETGCDVNRLRWRRFARLAHLSRYGIVHFFVADLDELEADQVRTTEAEEVFWCNVQEALDPRNCYPVIRNLRWLIPLAMDLDYVTASITDNSPA